MLIVLCKKSGALSVYRRNSLNLYSDKPLVELTGSHNSTYVIGENIGIIEYERGKVYQQYVFLTNRSLIDESPKIIAWEILISENE